MHAYNPDILMGYSLHNESLGFMFKRFEKVYEADLRYLISWNYNHEEKIIDVNVYL